MPSTPLSPRLASAVFRISSLYLIEPERLLEFARSERRLVLCRSEYEAPQPGWAAYYSSSEHEFYKEFL
jgi:hypothetical protein